MPAARGISSHAPRRAPLARDRKKAAGIPLPAAFAHLEARMAASAPHLTAGLLSTLEAAFWRGLDDHQVERESGVNEATLRLAIDRDWRVRWARDRAQRAEHERRLMALERERFAADGF